jgi:hypothetical protein
MHRGTTGINILLIVLAACAGPPAEPVDPSSVEVMHGEFRARASDGGLELTNSGEAPVYYRARDPLSLALSDRIPCLGPTNCPSVPAHSRVTLPFEEAIVGYRPGTERALVHWWRFVRQSTGGIAADRVRTIEVVLDER